MPCGKTASPVIMSGCGIGMDMEYLGSVNGIPQKLPWSSPICHTIAGGWPNNCQEKAGIH